MKPAVSLAWALAAAAQPAYVGAPACRACHAPQFASHAGTGHAAALSRAESHPLRQHFRAQPARGAVRFDVTPLQVRAWDRDSVLELPIEWAFGAGTQAVTFVTRVDASFYLEHAFTYYAATRGFALTPGQDQIQPATLREAVGLLYKTQDPKAGIDGCFECHSTGPLRTGPGREILVSEPGVQCEACHGPGAAHVRAASRGNVENPRRLTPARLNDFCGRCHRPPASEGVRIDWNYSWNVRHQPVYLAQSACFLKSSGKLSCLTCHGAHQGLEPKAAFYNTRCASCHAAPKHSSLSGGANCVDCHMPLVAPQPPLRFANHWIGIYGPGSKLRPQPGAGALRKP